MVFAMSFSNNLIDPPKQPQAVVVEVVRVETNSVDVHSDMWDSNWINRSNEKNLL